MPRRRPFCSRTAEDRLQEHSISPPGQVISDGELHVPIVYERVPMGIRRRASPRQLKRIICIFSELAREAMGSLRIVFPSARSECVGPVRNTNRSAMDFTLRSCSIPRLVAPSLEVDVVHGKGVKFYLSPITRGCEYAARQFCARGAAARCRFFCE